MQLMTRTEVASLLRITPQALSNHISKRNFDAVPPPLRIAGRNKWRFDLVVEWIEERSPDQAKGKGKKNVGQRGRPRKTASGGEA
jgi:hypothetical protein